MTLNVSSELELGSLPLEDAMSEGTGVVRRIDENSGVCSYFN